MKIFIWLEFSNIQNRKQFQLCIIAYNNNNNWYFIIYYFSQYKNLEEKMFDMQIQKIMKF